MAETEASGPGFRFEGRPVSARAGQSLAAALAAGGHVALSTAKDGAPRGAFCGMGMCHDCLVVVDGRAGQRACLTPVRDGMRVERQPRQPDLGSDGLAPLASSTGTMPERACDVLVVGAGPAGLAAAVAARTAGASVVVADERTSAGGQFYKQPATAAGRRRMDRQARAGAALIAEARARGVEILGGTLVWGAERRPDGTLAVAALRDGAALTLVPRRLVVATGAVERAPILPGWTLPGVMTAGALQTLIRGNGALPPGPILVAGNGPLNLQVAAEALRMGAELAGVVEAAPAPWTRPGEALALLRADARLAAAGLAAVARIRAAGVPIHWASRVLRVAGDGRAERTVVGRIDGSGAGRAIEARTVALGEGFMPANDLSRLLGCRHAPDGAGGLHAVRDRDGRSSLADVFVAGEAARFAGARVAEVAGALAGRAAARDLGFEPSSDEGLRRSLARHQRFQRALRRLFAAPDPGLARADARTIVCRCEALTLGALRDALARHAIADLPTLKRLSRAGMGRCQGRLCGGALAALLGSDPAERAGFAPQMPLRPVPVSALMAERPEWSGHRRSLPPPWRPDAATPHHDAPREAEVAVIGAGIVGLSTALFLARAGRDVLVIERAEPNALASGGNAGSLHAQLLSFDHGAKAAGAAGPAARTLPLQRDSIALWAELARDLGADVEMAITGGLMVAETERDLAFLRAKTAVERAMGIECDLIGAAELRALEPSLSDRFLGAALCPGEGKINPLLATQAILAGAEAAGARILRRAAVSAVVREDAGFRIETARGPVRAGRVVNAAGAFAGAVGQMAGADVPVHGAPLQMVVTEPAKPILRRLVAHADRHLTLKQAGNGAVLIGGGWTARLDPVHGHPRPLLASLAGNLWIAQRVLPALDRLHVVRSWAAMNIDIDGAPILGEDPRVPGLLHAVTSNGYTLGPLVGRITADLIDRGETDRDVSPFKAERFA